MRTKPKARLERAARWFAAIIVGCALALPGAAHNPKVRYFNDFGYSDSGSDWASEDCIERGLQEGHPILKNICKQRVHVFSQTMVLLRNGRLLLSPDGPYKDRLGKQHQDVNVRSLDPGEVVEMGSVPKRLDIPHGEIEEIGINYASCYPQRRHFLWITWWEEIGVCLSRRPACAGEHHPNYQCGINGLELYKLYRKIYNANTEHEVVHKDVSTHDYTILITNESDKEIDMTVRYREASTAQWIMATFNVPAHEKRYVRESDRVGSSPPYLVDPVLSDYTRWGKNDRATFYVFGRIRDTGERWITNRNLPLFNVDGQPEHFYEVSSKLRKSIMDGRAFWFGEYIFDPKPRPKPSSKPKPRPRPQPAISARCHQVTPILSYSFRGDELFGYRIPPGCYKSCIHDSERQCHSSAADLRRLRYNRAFCERGCRGEGEGGRVTTPRPKYQRPSA